MAYEPGQSGNPAGRPRGSRNRRTIAAEKLFDENAERLTQLAIKLADEGDVTALRLCMDRICPRAKHSPVAFQLPPMASAGDAITALANIVQGVADGDLTAIEAAELSMLVRVFSQTVVDSELEQRIRKLEATAKEMAAAGSDAKSR